MYFLTQRFPHYPIKNAKPDLGNFFSVGPPLHESQKPFEFHSPYVDGFLHSWNPKFLKELTNLHLKGLQVGQLPRLCFT